MDIAHHATIGFTGAMALDAAHLPLAGVAFLVASIFPDADVAATVFGKQAFLKHHQRLTHGLPCAVLCSLAAGLAAAVFIRPELFVQTALAWGCGAIVHTALDVSNTLGTQVFAPWGKRWRLDAVFFVDALSWFLTLATAMAVWWFNAFWPFALYGAVMAAMVAVRAQWSRQARAALPGAVAIPHPVWPGHYTLTRVEPDGSATLGTWSVWAGYTHEGTTPTPSRAAVALARSSPEAQTMAAFGRAFVVVEERTIPQGIQVILRDVAMRAIPHGYGTTTLTATPQGVHAHVAI